MNRFEFHKPYPPFVVGDVIQDVVLNDDDTVSCLHTSMYGSWIHEIPLSVLEEYCSVYVDRNAEIQAAIERLQREHPEMFERYIAFIGAKK